MKVGKIVLNEEEYLLVKLMEECSEISKVSAKWLRFGKNNYRKDSGNTISNFDELKKELAHLTAIRILLSTTAGENFVTVDDDEVTDLMSKTRTYMKSLSGIVQQKFDKKNDQTLSLYGKYDILVGTSFNGNIITIYDYDNSRAWRITLYGFDSVDVLFDPNDENNFRVINSNVSLPYEIFHSDEYEIIVDNIPASKNSQTIKIVNKLDDTIDRYYIEEVEDTNSVKLNKY